MIRLNDTQRIGLIGGLILIGLTFASGLAVYALMQRQAEAILVKSLETSLQSDRRLFENVITAGVAKALTVPTRPFVIQNLQRLKADAGDATARAALQRIADSFLETGFSGIAFYDVRDAEVVQAGTLARAPAFGVPLNAQAPARLLWDGRFVLQVVRDVVDANGVRIGTAKAEAALPQLQRAIAEAGGQGRSAELAVCAPLEADMQCFPLTRTQQVLERLPRVLDGQSLPMSHALEGASGSVSTRDYRHVPVVAAYAPVGTLGLGMVLKVDQDALFGPAREQLGVVAAVLAGLTLIGVALLLALTSPLVRTLVQSRQETAVARDKLHDLEERWRFALDSTGAGVWDLDVPAGRILLSERCKTMLGYSDAEIGDRLDSWHARIHPDDLPGLQAARDVVFEGRSEIFSNEHRKRCKDGSWKWVQVRGMAAARDATGRPLRLIGTYLDISARKAAEDTIRHQAHYDPLTQLPNRRLFLDRLGQDIVKARRDRHSLALLLIDLDEFKEVNDTLGHDAGDRLLQEAARRIRRCVRDSDTVARLGGDEFTVVLTELSSHAHAEDIAQKITDALAEPFHLGDEVVYVSASLGITLYPADADDIDTLMKHADQAMYAAKRQGRNRFCYFTASLQEAAQARLKLSRELREAVAGSQFVTHFQPIVDLVSGRVHKAEALVRWRHPSGELVNPAAFIPLAEETGLINTLGEWVFRESLQRANAWRRRFGDDFQISVNMSPVQFRPEGRMHTEAWLQHLQAIGLSGENLVVEITENLLLHAAPDITEQLFRFRDAGIRIAIDDFGTGYSTLSYLKQFPIDFLKIDRSFVRDLETDPNDMALSRAIILMAHELGLKVIAEGVETAAQRGLLAAAGCDYAQGYLYSKPLPPDAFEAWLAGRTAQ
ncbi:MAG: EAL domain-containing protein [Gammaproteobacteria bacterium]